MPDASLLFAFLGATVALNLSPGPDVLYVLANSAQHGTRGGLFASVGVSGGVLVHTLIAAAGVAAAIAAHPWAFDALRFLGAAWLVWLGIQAWRASGTAPGRATGSNAWQILGRGFATNLLNPKVGLFFLAFLPQFVAPERGSATKQMLLLGAMFIASGTLVNVGYAVAGGWVSRTLRREPRWKLRLDRISGSILLALGLRLLLPQR